ncbi:class I SAM-dependent methyltransferase [Pelagicoccus sp. SDUM812003]|uniref:class I SAM-dependent methyltransferase n=1 Tax=Pelagicoccus sp. SDUM812003 TaxID=3041267 RepID=UPI00280C4761|nr:class I SAM-dependent methyltransferase [Pelagicoccus sp. SDUM812003]MDQ8205631.1 class I SAM-dependent methyltransferase [Pelagicoccus sp. SDUM812003]
MNKKETEKDIQTKQDIEYRFPYHYIPEYKKNFFQNFTWGWSINYVTAIEFILEEIKELDQNIQSIYDLGCGDGRITKELHEEFNNKEVIGIDYSERAINLAKAMSPAVDYKRLDITEAKNMKKVDALTLIEVLEHIPLKSCENFVNALSGLINTGGFLFLTVPHKNVPVSYKHFQHFDLETLKKYFEGDFTFEKVCYIQKSPVHKKLVSKIINNNFYVIKSKTINNAYHRYYKNHCFHAKNNNCERIYLRLKKK